MKPYTTINSISRWKYFIGNLIYIAEIVRSSVQVYTVYHIITQTNNVELDNSSELEYYMVIEFLFFVVLCYLRVLAEKTFQ